MSLVHEALQKAEREKRRKTGDPAPASIAVASPAPSSAPLLTSGATPAAPAVAADGRRRSDPASPSSHSLLAVLISCVAVVGIVAIVWLVSRTPNPAARPARAEADASAHVVSPSPPSRESPAEPAAHEDPLPANTTPVPPVDFKLTGIMQDPQGTACAVVNGRVVYEQHYVDGAIVKRIERDRVTLSIGTRELVLRLN